jgi:RecA-family ATPase
LADVEPERVRWLWSRRLPLGKLVTLDGDPDVGKSTLCLDLAARLTTGRPMPGEALALVPASDVVLLAAEDGLGDTIRPRLDAAGADVARVHHFDAVPIYDEHGQVAAWAPPTLPEHIGALETLARSTGAVLVVVDVLMAYLSGRADSHRDQDVRRGLAPLAEMAERVGACVLLLRHVPKSQRRAGAGLSAGSGSMGIIGLARAGMVAAVDPEDPTGQRRVLARAKGNLAPPWRSLGNDSLTWPRLGRE